MSKLTSKYIFTILVIISAYILLYGGVYLVNTFFNKGENPPDSVNYLLIRAYTGFENKESQAVLINDKTEIGRIYRSLTRKYSNNHACWYDWNFVFLEYANKHYDSFAINEECTKFDKSIIKPYLEKVRNDPTHYIYYVEISSTKETGDVLKDFRQDDQFVLIEENSHLPFIEFELKNVVTDFKRWELDKRKKTRAEEETREMYKKLIDKINNKFPIKSKSEEDISNFSWSCGFRNLEEIACRAEVTLRFEKNTNIDEVAKCIESEGGRIKDQDKSDSYHIQLITKQDNLGELKQRLSDDFDYVLDVQRFKIKDRD